MINSHGALLFIDKFFFIDVSALLVYFLLRLKQLHDHLDHLHSSTVDEVLVKRDLVCFYFELESSPFGRIHGLE